MKIKHKGEEPFGSKFQTTTGEVGGAKGEQLASAIALLEDPKQKLLAENWYIKKLPLEEIRNFPELERLNWLDLNELLSDTRKALLKILGK